MSFIFSFFYSLFVKRTNNPPKIVATVPSKASMIPNPKNRLYRKQPKAAPKIVSGTNNANTINPSANRILATGPLAI